MLPPLLSEDICSLCADGEKRLAFTMDLFLDTEANIIDTKFSNTAILLSNNYVYECAELSQDPAYTILYELAKRQNASVQDSHDVVAHWMVKMNHICGQTLAQRKAGIFRKANATPTQSPNIPVGTLPENTRRIIQTYATISAEYVISSQPVEHCVMELTNYVHITSPIRRIVDILNQMWLQWELGILPKEMCSSFALDFFGKRLENLGHINDSVRSIRKLQQECETLYKIVENPSIQERAHRGIVVEIDNERKKCVVYLEELNMMITVKECVKECVHLYKYYEFRVFVFEDEYAIQRKLRWTFA
jgi:exoribonuclease R